MYINNHAYTNSAYSRKNRTNILNPNTRLGIPFFIAHKKKTRGVPTNTLPSAAQNTSGLPSLTGRRGALTASPLGITNVYLHSQNANH